MMRPKVLIGGLVFVGGLLLCLWQMGGYTYGLRADSLDAPTRSSSEQLPPLIVRQSSVFAPSVPVENATSEPAGGPRPRQALVLAGGGAPGALNGVPVDQFVILDERAKQNALKVYAWGQARGNNPHAFSKIGDSNMENPFFMAPFDEAYNLGPYASLQPAVDYFTGSFGRQSMAVHTGFHSWSVLDAEMADKTVCWPYETPLGCEVRVHNPSIALIRLGTNDAGYPERLQESLTAIVEYCVSRGVVPILGTKADRAEGPDDAYNAIIRRVAAQNAIPLWDFDRVASTLPGNGLGQDRVHLTTSGSDYTLPEAFERGHSVDNLAALMALDQVWREMAQVN